MTEVRRISNSEIQTFKDCRRKWWLAYYRQLQPRHEKLLGAAALGGRIHRALASWYVPNVADRVDPRETLERVSQEDRATLVEQNIALHGTNILAPDVAKKFTSDLDLERAMIEGYMEWIAETGADSDLEIVGAEEYVEVDFAVFREFFIKIVGKIDVRAYNRINGAISFVDHKTVGTIADALKGLQINEQMLHYLLIQHILEPDRPAGGAIYSMLRKVKRTAKATPPFYHREFITHNKYEMEAFETQLRGVISDIIATEIFLRNPATRNDPRSFVYPRPSRDCSWKCPFVQVCPMFNDGSRVEAMIEAHFVRGDPLSYYGQEGVTRSE